MTKVEDRSCKGQDCPQKQGSGNCSVLGADGLAVQCVGPWAEDKYFFLERYLGASRQARKKFAIKGNAVYIDLYAGPGKCIVREIKKEIEGGGMRAAHLKDVPFNEYHYFDISSENTSALKQRLGNNKIHIQTGDSNILIDQLATRLNIKPYRYHFAYVDPFGADALKFTTIKKLAAMQRMDLLINFPIGSIKRNLKAWLRNENTILDDFLGTDLWRKKVKSSKESETYKILVDTYTEQLLSIGYPKEGLKTAQSDKNIYSGLPTVSVKNTKDVELYVLILASKHKLGQKIWNSVIKVTPSGQRSLF